MQNVKKSLSIKILASFTLLFLLIALIVPIFEKKGKIQSVSAADSTVVEFTFESSDLYIPMSRAYTDGNDYNNNKFLDYLLYDLNLYYNSVSGELSVNFDDFRLFYMYDLGIYDYDGDDVRENSRFNYSFGDYLYLADATAPSWNSEQITITPGSYWLAFGLNDSTPSGEWIANFTVRYSVNVVLDSGFNNQIASIVITSDSLCYNVVEYICTNGATLALRFYLNELNSNQLLDYRRYYILDPLTMSDSDLYNSGYDYGYNLGYNNGQLAGNNEGYKNGYDVGVIEGYNNGYTKGVEHGGDYTFSSLLGAVIDVPVKTFTSLFNFELLGVNLAAFFSGLLTLAVIVTIVKLLI